MSIRGSYNFQEHIKNAFDELVGRSKEAFDQVKSSWTEFKSREIFFRSLGLPLLGVGAQKIVIDRSKIPKDLGEYNAKSENEPDKVLIVGVKTFFISQGNAVRKEGEKMGQILKEILNNGGDPSHLHLEAKPLKGKDGFMGHYTLEMDKAQLGSFESVIRDPKISLETRIKLISDLFEGLAQLHRAGYAYGDIKPENCLVFKDKEGNLFLKITDFGKTDLVKEGEERLHPGNLRFCAPEAKFTQKNDVWGVALVAIRALEEGLKNPGHPLISQPADDAKALSRRGLEKFIVESKAFLGLDERKIKNKLIKRHERLLQPEKFSADIQSKTIGSYIEILKEQLGAQGMDKLKANALGDLLKNMTKADPIERWDMDLVVSMFNNEIFPKNS